MDFNEFFFVKILKNLDKNIVKHEKFQNFLAILIERLDRLSVCLIIF